MIIHQTLRLTLLVAAVVNCSCTTELEFIRLDPGKSIEGVVYHLPATALIVEATYELVECKGNRNFNISDVTIKTEVVPDVEQASTYILDHKKLRAGLKVIDTAKIELHPNRILKKVTYTAKDETREAIKDAAGVATKIALAAGGLPVPAVGQSFGALTESVPSRCNTETEEALVRKEELNRQIKSLTKSLNDELAKFPGANNTELVGAIKAQLDDLVSRLVKLRADRLILKSSDRIRPRLEQLKDVPVKINLSVFKKWFDDKAEIGEIEKDNQFLLTFVRPADHFLWAPLTEEAKNHYNDVTGVVYRLPPLVEIKLKYRNKDYEIPDRFPILQFGRLAKFEVKNGPFQSTKHEIEFDTSGNLTLFNFTESTAQARAIIGTVGDIVPAIANFEHQRLTQQAALEAKKKELAEAEKARIKAERELAEERAK